MPKIVYASGMPTRKSSHPAHQNTSLPAAPTLARTIGPSFILLGLALGSGELILWPHLASKYGLGLLWGGLLGISLQFVLNTEAMRYSLAWGESVFLGFRKLNRWWPVWFILSTFIPWSLPGFSSASAQILANLFGFEQTRGVALLLLFLTGVILTTGKTLYSTMEKLQKAIIAVGLPFLAAVTLYLAQPQDWAELGRGFMGQGDGWWFFPPGIMIASFLGAFAYSGAGGNLNLAQSYYIKEKGFGMGRYLEKISSLLRGGSKSVAIEGRVFADTAANQTKWKQWWTLVNTEHFLIFWLLGIITIALLAVLAKVLTYGQADPNDIAFLYQEGRAIAEQTIPAFGTFFLLTAAIMLFSTQIGVLESSSRIISENILLLFYHQGQKFNLSLAFYLALWGQIALGAFLLLAGIQQPRLLLTLAAILNGAAMMVAFPLLYWLNTTHLMERYQPGILRKVAIGAGFSFFLLFFGILVKDLL